jgi:hypothetical protein
LKTILFLLLFAVTAAGAQEAGAYDKKKDDALIEYFSNLDLDAFEGARADSFLRTLKHPYRGFRIGPSENNLYGGLLVFTYDYNIEVHLYLDGFRYANPYGICRKRNRRLAGKEIIRNIQVRNGIACIQGCT